MKYYIKIYPVQRHQSTAIKLILRILGPDEFKRAKELVTAGGVIGENLSEETAKQLAFKLRDLGVKVDIREINNLPNLSSVIPVQTAIPAFVGITKEIKDAEGNSVLNVPIRITSILEYEKLFGKSDLQTFILDVEQDYSEEHLQIINTNVKLFGSAPELPRGSNLMYYALQMYYSNGGGPCYIVSAEPGKFTEAIDALIEFDEPTIIASPGAVYEANYSFIVDKILQQCNVLKDRVGIIDVPDAIQEGNTNNTDVTDNFRTLITNDLSSLKYGAAYYPYLHTSIPFLNSDSTIIINEHKIRVLDSADNDVSHNTSVSIPLRIEKGASLNDSRVNNLHSNLYDAVIEFVNEFTVTLPPSSAIASLYVKVDKNRGVWKAPANVSISNIKGPTINVTNQFQEELNVDPIAGKSVNAIRTFTGKGTLVWGARTLAGNDNEWRYIPVRRLVNFLEESIKKSTANFVFEPNTSSTWMRIRTMIENFLVNLWRDGALAGARPEHSFFVKVGLGETMSSQDILEGRIIVEIGIAVVRPAEFIIFKISHEMQDTA